MELRKILLVCAATCIDVEDCLTHAGCVAVKVKDGTAAVFRARHEQLDAAILVSTGREMDLAETALNLRDIDSSLEIIILADYRSEPFDQTDTLAQAIPNTRVLSRRELNEYLGAPVAKRHH